MALLGMCRSCVRRVLRRPMSSACSRCGSGRRRLTLLLLAVIGSPILASPPATASASDHAITIVGTGDRSVIVRVTKSVTFNQSPLDLLGGPGWGTLTTPDFGFAVSRLADGHVVAGRVRSQFIENELHVIAEIPLGDPGQVLTPGSYRVTLLGRGAIRVVAHAAGTSHPLVWHVAEPTRVHFDAGMLVPLSPVAGLSEHRGSVFVSPHTFLSLVSAYGGGAGGDTFESECLTAQRAPTCVGGSPSPAGGFGVGEGGSYGSGGFSGMQWQPGKIASGSYMALTQATTYPTGPHSGYVLVALQ
ncbi:MAG: hypothetical protein QOG99_2344 [Frankiales bacterium]|nr:hypothetical protein [Frankiales bacterium]